MASRPGGLVQAGRGNSRPVRLHRTRTAMGAGRTMTNLSFYMSALLPILLVAVCLPEDDLRRRWGAGAWLLLGTVGVGLFAETAGTRVAGHDEALLFGVAAALIFFLVVAARIILLQRASRRPAR